VWAFWKYTAKERERIIEDNQLCAFCLLHNKGNDVRGEREAGQASV
jgi:hypothetical protein